MNSYTHSCTLNGNGQIIVEHTMTLFPTGPSLQSKEVRAAAFSVKEIQAVIAEAAQGNIAPKDKILDIPPFDVGFKHQYFAYQKQDGVWKRVFLINKVDGGLVNDAPAVKPLVRFIDSVCGDLSSTVDKSYAARAKFSEVVLNTSAIKAAIDVCAMTNNGFGTAGSAAACDGTPSGDLGVFGALDQVRKQIAATPPFAAKTASVTITLVDAKHIVITATAVTSGGLNGETYVLRGAYVAGMVKWAKDSTSTCIAASFC
jgi:type IV pilus assembly protein PilA